MVHIHDSAVAYCKYNSSLSFAGFMDLNIFAVAAVSIFMVRAEPLLKVPEIAEVAQCFLVMTSILVFVFWFSPTHTP